MRKTLIIIGVLLITALLVLEACALTTAPKETAPALEETPAPAPESPPAEPTPPEDTLLSVEAFTVFTDPLGKFSVEYPDDWFINEVSGEDAYNLFLDLVLEPSEIWEDEISLYLGFWFHSSGEAEFFCRQWADLAGGDLISMSGPNTTGGLFYWEFSERLGEKIRGGIYCDWEDCRLDISYSYPQNKLTEVEENAIHKYALHMLSTFHIYGSRLSEREINIHKLVNDYRQQNGLCTLEFNEFMSTLAREHSERQSMLNPISFSGEKGLGISHEGFNERAGRILTTLGASIVGENVAMGYDNSASLVDAWLNSPEHRENIMNPAFRRTGIGLAGSIATQIFSD